MKFPDISYTTPHKPTPKKRTPPPKRPANQALSMFSDEWEPPKTKIGEFWELYHDMDNAPDTPEVSKVKARILAVANAKGYVIKPDLSKTVRVFLEMGKCPWSHEMCPCARLKQEGYCKKGMIAKGQA
jgi:hypothetical protein